MSFAGSFSSRVGHAVGDVAGQALASKVAPMVPAVGVPVGEQLGADQAPVEQAAAERAAARLGWVWPVGIGLGFVAGLVVFSARKKAGRTNSISSST